MQTSVDGFLDGRLQVRQPLKGFRSGADAVLLAASVPAHPGQSVLELGIGVGVASLCLSWRVSTLSQVGLEIQPIYADIARTNAAENKSDLMVLSGDIADPPKDLSAMTFDHVIMNPPYYRAGAWTRTQAGDRATALGESASLNAWIDLATRRARPGGILTIIQKADRLADVIIAADDRLGGLEIKPICPREGRPAELVVFRYKKGGRAATKLHSPLVMHRGDQHRQDAAHPTEAAANILRHGEKLEF